MALVHFTVTAAYEAIISDTDDVGAEPDSQGISALVTFTPSVSEIASPTENKIIRLQPITGRLEEDGILKTLDGDVGVRLVANSAALGPLPELTYLIEFSHVVYDQDRRLLDSFTITAPSTDVTVALEDVHP